MQPNRPATLEVCVDDVAGLQVCQTGADRIELCSALDLGGLTPSAGLIEAARASAVPVHAMVRPRVGSFEYSQPELDVMLADIAEVHAAGLAGVVLGATRGDGLDLAAIATLREAAGDLDCTLHRAIDLLTDPVAALEQVIELGFSRILTSGGAIQAQDGVARLAAMKDAAADRIEVMAGSGVTPSNVARLAVATGIRSFHASCAVGHAASDHAVAFGFAPSLRKRTDPTMIAEMKTALAAL